MSPQDHASTVSAQQQLEAAQREHAQEVESLRQTIRDLEDQQEQRIELTSKVLQRVLLLAGVGPAEADELLAQAREEVIGSASVLGDADDSTRRTD